MAVQRVMRSWPVIEYTGSNSAEMLAAGQGAVGSGVLTIDSESGGTLVLKLQEEGPTFFTFHVGDFLDLRNQVGVLLAGEVAKMSVLVRQSEVGAANIPALLLGASATVVVTLSGTFPDTNYSVKARAVAGGAILATLTVTELSRTAGTVTYSVKAVGVATGAGVLLVDAAR